MGYYSSFRRDRFDADLFTATLSDADLGSGKMFLAIFLNLSIPITYRFSCHLIAKLKLLFVYFSLSYQATTIGP